jgi:cytochrome c-type biogenesis protein CcmH
MHMSRTMWWVVLGVAWLLLAWPAVASHPPSGSGPAATGQAEHPDHAVGEEAVFMRLLAPCCWQQTLDVHDSPLATELRGEVRALLRTGQSPEAIEQAMVARYGDRIIALSREDPLDSVSVALAFVALAVGAALIWAGLRWVRASPSDAEEGKPKGRDAYDDRLDAALEELDD